MAAAKLARVPVVKVWRSGLPKRKFLFVDDMADACIHIMNLDKGHIRKFTEPMMSHINLGSGEEYSIKKLAELIASVIGYQGTIQWDSAKPDGAPRKLLNIQKLNSLGWRSKVGLEKGLLTTYQWFLSHQEKYRR